MLHMAAICPPNNFLVLLGQWYPLVWIYDYSALSGSPEINICLPMARTFGTSPAQSCHHHSLVSDHVVQPRSWSDSQAADKSQLLFKELPTMSPGVKTVNSVRGTQRDHIKENA